MVTIRKVSLKEPVSSGSRAFSLIEVVLAMGVLVFAVLSMVVLLPIGLQANRDSHEESVATNLITAMVSDWRSLAVGATNGTTPVFQLPALSQGMTLSNTLGFGANGQITNITAARYRVVYKVVAPSSASTNSPFVPYYVDFAVSWPAQATNGPSTVETMAAIPPQ